MADKYFQRFAEEVIPFRAEKPPNEHGNTVANLGEYFVRG